MPVAIPPPTGRGGNLHICRPLLQERTSFREAKGDFIHRSGAMAIRLLLGYPYSITLAVLNENPLSFH
jgi:hypothetical protein